jgi:type II secretory pathway component PulF
MTEPTPLRATYARLHDMGMPGALAVPQAIALEAALSRGEPASEAAARLGLDARLVDSLAVEAPTDAPSAVRGLALLLAEHEAARTRLRSTVAYPLLLASSLSLATAMVLGMGVPALSHLPGSSAVHTGGVTLGVVALVIASLVALSAALAGRVRLPGIGDIHRQLDSAAVLQCLRVLTASGVGLPAALRAGASWCGARHGARCRSLAQALARGGSVDTATGVVLFEHSEVRMLFSAAQAGTLRPSLEALSAHRRAVVSRRIPDFIARVQTVSVCITAVGVITVGVTFFREYSRAVL